MNISSYGFSNQYMVSTHSNGDTKVISYDVTNKDISQTVDNSSCHSEHIDNASSVSIVRQVQQGKVITCMRRVDTEKLEIDALI